jgi:hypothetical protein
MTDDSRIEDVIAADARNIEAPIPTLKELQERLDQVELLIEQVGKTGQLVANLTTYLDDLRGEISSIKMMRRVAFFFALGFIAAIDLLGWYLLFKNTWFRYQETYFKGAVIVAIITATVVLLSIILRGAFQSISARHKDEMLPPHVKELYDAARMILGQDHHG